MRFVKSIFVMGGILTWRQMARGGSLVGWCVAQQVTRTDALPPGAVVWVVEFAIGEAEAAAADAAIQTFTQCGHLGNARVQLGAEIARYGLPVGFGGRAVFRQSRQSGADVGDGESQPLRDHHKAEAANVGPAVAALAAVGAVRKYQPLVLVVANCGDRQSGAFGDVPNRESRGAQAQLFCRCIVFQLFFPLELKCT